MRPHTLESSRLLCPWDSPGKNTGMGRHSLLQRIFLIQGLNPSLLHWQAGSSPLSQQGSPRPDRGSHKAPDGAGSGVTPQGWAGASDLILSVFLSWAAAQTLYPLLQGRWEPTQGRPGSVTRDRASHTHLLTVTYAPSPGPRGHSLPPTLSPLSLLQVEASRLKLPNPDLDFLLWSSFSGPRHA